jgi:pSer/pThr/pTyr-binding forkhead associated (FHA) protein
MQIGEGRVKTVSVPLRERLVVGRSTSSGGDQPDLDFSSLSALEHGVSRLHAVLTYENEVLYVEDLNSSNGTRINGFQIKPAHKYRLRNNDEIEFGRLRVQVRVVRVGTS